MEEITSLKEDPVVKKIYSMTNEMGFEAFLVGGLLRDLLLFLPVGQDYDFVLAPETEGYKRGMREIVEKIALELNGSFFPLDLKEGVYRVIIQVSSEIKSPVLVDLSPLKGEDIEEDLRQRDFTINAMALSLRRLFKEKTIELIDPLGGMKDLKRGLLRASSKDVFVRDPVRLLRAFRFTALYGFQIEVETRKSIEKGSFRLSGSSWERIRDEFFSILETTGACHHVEDLFLLGLLKEIIPQSGGWGDRIPDNTFPSLREEECLLDSIGDITPVFTSELTDYFQDTLGGVSKRSLLKFAALIHDIWGTSLGVEEDDSTTLRERVVIMRRIGERLKLSNKTKTLLVDSVKNLPTAFHLLTAPEIKDLDIYLFFKGLGRDGIFLIFLSLAGIKAGGKIVKGTIPRIEKILRYLFEVHLEFLSSPLLTGSDVMEVLGVPQGEKVGYILRQVEEARAEGLIGNRREAIEYIRGCFGVDKGVDK